MTEAETVHEAVVQAVAKAIADDVDPHRALGVSWGASERSWTSAARAAIRATGRAVREAAEGKGEMRS